MKIKKELVAIILGCLCAVVVTGCTKEEVKENVDKAVEVASDGVDKIKDSEVYKDVTSYVKEKGSDLCEKGAEKVQEYIKEAYGKIESINGVTINSKKNYVITFTTDDGKSHEVEFEYDVSTDCLSIENEK
jgi:dihydroneopterin aldolase